MLQDQLNGNGYSEDEKALIRETLAEIKQRQQPFTSDLFRRTVVLTVPKVPTELTVSKQTLNEFWNPVREHETEKGNPTPSFDDDIWGWDAFKGKTMPAIPEDVSTTLYRFLKTLSHRQILDEGEAKKIKKIYNWREALHITREAILNNEVDIRGTAVITYFKVPGVDTLFRFSAFRFDDGQLGVDVVEVGLDSKYDAENGVCFSN